ncbi:UTP--glucose-1-phosphate uridylyltransferase GalU [Priestia sp. FSL W8-0001]|uniref:UTP--glucose-1-phosphate uridylyltransferase GalU n=1 Tax=unclassified Priestia TaxID=2800374 RepID=UPI0030F9286C
MKKVKKAIIPAAGLGTRFLPATKAMPKEMLPIVDKPTIQYIVEEAVAAGIEDIIIVTGKNKRAIEDHFDYAFELEQNLFEKQKLELLETVRSISNMVDVHYIRQKEPKGLGHAVWCARTFIGDDPFAVLLGDIIIDKGNACLKDLIDCYEETQTSTIAVQQVPTKDIHQYGVIDGDEIETGKHLIKQLVEKPKVNPPSNLAILGRYVLDPTIFNILEHIGEGAGGEIQLTDALNVLAKEKQMYSKEYTDKTFDVGSKIGFLAANIEYALKSPELKHEFSNYLKNLIEEKEVVTS